MRKARKGFTLIEILIAVAVLAALAATMTISSSDAIDQAQASSIINNLQSMKTAAYTMYMQRPDVASITNITGSSKPGQAPDSGNDNRKTVSQILGEFLGRIDIAAHYGIVGEASHWYVWYKIQPEDSAKVKEILEDKANATGLLGGYLEDMDEGNFTWGYDEDSGSTHIALMVR